MRAARSGRFSAPATECRVRFHAASDLDECALGESPREDHAEAMIMDESPGHLGEALLRISA